MYLPAVPFDPGGLKHAISVHQSLYSKTIDHTSDLMLKVTKKALFQWDLGFQDGLALSLRWPARRFKFGLRHGGSNSQRVVSARIFRERACR